MDHLVKYYNFKKSELVGYVKESGSSELEERTRDIIRNIESFDTELLKESYRSMLTALLMEITKSGLEAKLSALFIEHDIWGYEGYLYGYVGGEYPLLDGSKDLDYECFGEQDFTSEGYFDYSVLWKVADDETIEFLESAYYPDSGLFSFFKEYLAASAFVELGNVISELQSEMPVDHLLNRIPIYANEHDMPQVSISAV